MTTPSMHTFDNDDDLFLDTLCESIVKEIREWNNTHDEKVSESMQQEIIERKCKDAGCDYEEYELFEFNDFITTLLVRSN